MKVIPIMSLYYRDKKVRALVNYLRALQIQKRGREPKYNYCTKCECLYGSDEHKACQLQNCLFD
jgi:hypothetical protein